MAEETKQPEAVEETTETTANEAAPAVETQEHPHRNIVPGMIVRVHERIKDVNAKGEEKMRTQVFEGIVLGAKNGGVQRTITVQKDSGGILVEKIFPLASPNIEKIEVTRQFQANRAKLHFLRDRKFKRKMKEIKKVK